MLPSPTPMRPASAAIPWGCPDSGNGLWADSSTHLLANGVFHDDGAYDSLWQRVVERLNLLRSSNINHHTDVLEKLRHYPALLATFAMGIAATLGRREEFLARILTQPVWAPPWRRTSHGKSTPRGRSSRPAPSAEKWNGPRRP
ncbi:hypothetical protein [Streptomyces chartreusis]|uniref:hypothetical protein n=1 Tax=Streptomyces chartreusis TaxID=1969 RepID=UPI003808469A